jgi:hypothetical protein
MLVQIPVVLSLGLFIGVWLHAEGERRTRIAALTREHDEVNRRRLATVDYGHRLAGLRASDR